MKRFSPWSEEHLQKRRRLASAESNEDKNNTVAPSPSTFKNACTQKQDTSSVYQNRSLDSKTSWILNWIPQPPAGCDDSISHTFEDIDVKREADYMDSPLPPPKRSRVGSTASVTDISDDTRPDYNSPDFLSYTENRGYFLKESKAGPDQNDIAFYRRLLQHKSQQAPRDTMFEDPKYFRDTLRGQSEMRIHCSLHFLLVPGADFLFLRGQKHLEHVADGVNDSWMKVYPIIKSKPQPDHSRCLKISAFNEEERQKLQNIPPGAFSYAVREELYFPYLTCEIKSDTNSLGIADRQNMHNMFIALRSLVQLAEAAGTPEKLHRRVLGYSISHDLDNVRIHGYYPEIGERRTEYFQCEVANFGIWTEESPWKCYSFVESLDAEFLPKHIALIKELLAGVKPPSPFKIPPLPRSRQYTPSTSGAQTPSFAGSIKSPNLATTMKEMHQDLVQQLEISREETREIKQEAKDLRQEAKEREKAAVKREEALRQDLNYYQKLVQTLITERLPWTGESNVHHSGRAE